MPWLSWEWCELYPPPFPPPHLCLLHLEAGVGIETISFPTLGRAVGTPSLVHGEPHICTVRPVFFFPSATRTLVYGLFHLLTTLAKLILFNYLPGLSLNTFCVKFTVFSFSNRNGLNILVKI